MKAYLINPAEWTVTTVEHDDTTADIYRQVGCETFDVAHLPGGNGDGIYIDDEGALKAEDNPEGARWFALPGIHPWPLYGNGLVLGCDNAGDSKSPQIEREQLEKVLLFGVGRPGRALIQALHASYSFVRHLVETEDREPYAVAQKMMTNIRATWQADEDERARH
jgi:hypothetical protein